MGPFMLKKTISKHYDSINALAFSHDGSLFASGADDGLIMVFQGHGSGREIRRFQVKAPVTTLLWHSRFGYTIVAGDASGDVHTLSLRNDSDVSVSYGCVPATTEKFWVLYRGTRSTMPSIVCLAQFTAWHRVVFGWLSVPAKLFS
jgi:WD40 repeat protein